MSQIGQIWAWSGNRQIIKLKSFSPFTAANTVLRIVILTVKLHKQWKASQNNRYFIYINTFSLITFILFCVKQQYILVTIIVIFLGTSFNSMHGESVYHVIRLQWTFYELLTLLYIVIAFISLKLFLLF